MSSDIPRLDLAGVNNLVAVTGGKWKFALGVRPSSTVCALDAGVSNPKARSRRLGIWGRFKIDSRTGRQ